jgi:sugar phosphate isomerase/epimerase
MQGATGGRSISTWSLHRTLGRFAAEESAFAGGPFLLQSDRRHAPSLLELLPEIAAHGYDSLQICHFHLESRDPEYLERFRSAAEANNISIEMLLIDDGDLTAADKGRHLAWYDDWLDAAQTLGAQRARIGAGRSKPTEERLRASGQRLATLARSHPGVRIVTENWLELTPDAKSTLAVLAHAGDQIGLLIDLGNWKGPDKYRELAKIAPRAESCHAKCHFTVEGPDESDYRKGLEILKNAGFNGSLALIYDGPDADEWAGLDQERAIVSEVFG